MPRATITPTKRPSRTSAKSEDAIAFLKSEHRDVEDLFKRFEGLGDTAHKSRQTTVGKMIEALSKHAAIEEQVLYPRCGTTPRASRTTSCSRHSRSTTS